MKKLITILIILSIPFHSFTQTNNVSLNTIKDVRKLDSLFRQIPKYSSSYIKINSSANQIEILHRGQDTGLVHPTSIKIIDTTTLIKYCDNVKMQYHLVKTIINLLLKNKFSCIIPFGPDSCTECSNAVFFKSNSCFVIKDLKSTCMPNNCFLTQKTNQNEKLKKWIIENITDDIVIVKRSIN